MPRRWFTPPATGWRLYSSRLRDLVERQLRAESSRQRYPPLCDGLGASPDAARNCKVRPVPGWYGVIPWRNRILHHRSGRAAFLFYYHRLALAWQGMRSGRGRAVALRSDDPAWSPSMTAREKSTSRMSAWRRISRPASARGWRRWRKNISGRPAMSRARATSSSMSARALASSRSGAPRRARGSSLSSPTRSPSRAWKRTPRRFRMSRSIRSRSGRSARTFACTARSIRGKAR